MVIFVLVTCHVSIESTVSGNFQLSEQIIGLLKAEKAFLFINYFLNVSDKPGSINRPEAHMSLPPPN
jgi:hypothetical protein